MSAVAAPAPDVSKWAAWTPSDVAEILSDVGVPWYVAGGWSIDLFLGGERRPHADLEIAVPQHLFGDIATALAEYELHVVSGGAITAARDAAVLETTHQTWVYEPAADAWRVDVLREPSSGDAWVYRRDERICLPYDRLIRRTDDGIPYGSPEVTLLFKAPHAGEDKHSADFAAARPFLSDGSRAWLLDTLELAHPGHVWIPELRERGA